MVNSMANQRFCSRDATTADVSAVVSDCRRTIRFSSVYLPYEEPDPPSAMMMDIVQPSAEEELMPTPITFCEGAWTSIQGVSR
jgi:hypothetical protein